MAGSKSNYLELELLDHVLGGADYVRPANVHIALYTVAPTDAGGGNEVAVGAYARIQVVNNATNWPAASAAAKKNAVAITFTTATASWGTIVAFAILDAATAGNFLYWADLTTTKQVQTNDVAKFPISAISITED